MPGGSCGESVRSGFTDARALFSIRTGARDPVSQAVSESYESRCLTMPRPCHVRPARDPGLQDRHHLAHALQAYRAGLSDRRSDRSLEFRIRHLLGQVTGQQVELGLSFSTRSLRPAFANCSIESLRCLISLSTMPMTTASSTVIRSSTSFCLIAPATDGWPTAAAHPWRAWLTSCPRDPVLECW